MTGMKVTSASVSGSRLIRAMLRLISTQTSVMNMLDRAASGTFMSWSWARSRA